MAAKFKQAFKNGTAVLELRARRGDDSLFKFRTERTHRKRVGWPDAGVWFLSFMALMIGCHGYQEQRFAMEPQDQNAAVGSNVILPCRVVNKVGTLQWTKDDFGLGTHRNLSGFERYAMIGSDEEGDYSLEIRNVTLEDDGRYQCQVSSGLNGKHSYPSFIICTTLGEPPIRSRYAQVSVQVAPGNPPRIIQGAFIEAIEGQTVDIECESSGGKPASEITWLLGNNSVIKHNVKSIVEMLEDGQRFKTRSVLRLRPRKEHHNQTITCQAQNIADRASRMATVHIEVRYAPKLNMTVQSASVNGRIPEGAEARVLCMVDSNPPPQVYRWYINNIPVVGDYVEEMIIFNVTRKHNNAIVKCEVSNPVGKSEHTLNLEVTYPPTFRTRPQNIEASIGDKVRLTCDVDGQPKPGIKWLYHEPGRIGVKGNGTDLEIIVRNETAGRYICKASVKGYPEIQSEAVVFIKGPPQIISNRTQFGSEGEEVRIECAALSVPRHDDISWYFEGREIKFIEHLDYAPLEPIELPDGIVKFTLVIRASQSKHYGIYNCSVTNQYGNANAAIVLKSYKTLPLFIIMTGVTSGIIIFSAFIVLVVMCHRKRRMNQQKNEKPDVTVNTSDMYKESDRSSNISDIKLQLPNGDGVYDLDYTSSNHSDSKPGIPLSGPVSLPGLRHDELLQFRYSNDYSDPAYSDSYYNKFSSQGPIGCVYDYPQGYGLPTSHLRVQSPQLDVPSSNRSLQGSLTRSIDTASTLPLSAGNGSQNNSLQRTNKDDTDAINSLGLPIGGDTPPAPIYAQPARIQNGVDVRYAATYGNPYLRNSTLAYPNTSKPTSTPAPPPYSAVRSSVVIPTGNGNAPAQGTHV